MSRDKDLDDVRLLNQGKLLDVSRCDGCRNTGAVPMAVRLIEPRFDEYGNIVYVKEVQTSWARCTKKCLKSRRWQQFHNLNVEARLEPVYKDVLKRKMMEDADRLKAQHLSETGKTPDPFYGDLQKCQQNAPEPVSQKVIDLAAARTIRPQTKT